MKINELLKPNEGFNLNEAQVAGNRCCFHIHTGAGLRDFRALLLPPHIHLLLLLFLHPSLPPPPSPLPPQSPILAPLGPPGQRGDKGAPIISLLVLIWAAQGFQVPPITPRNIITSSPGNTVPRTHTLLHTHASTDCQIQMLADCNGLYMHSKHTVSSRYATNTQVFR